MEGKPEGQPGRLDADVALDAGFKPDHESSEARPSDDERADDGASECGPIGAESDTPDAPLDLCPTFDALFGLTEPASCSFSSSLPCAFDREESWVGFIEGDWFGVNVDDCRFGQWNSPPIVNLFTALGLTQDSYAILMFGFQLFGCPAAGNAAGPLPFPFVLTDLQSLSFTTADLAALSDDYVQAIREALSDNGSPPLTACQIAAFRAQLASAASRVPGITASSTLSFSTCGDAGRP